MTSAMYQGTGTRLLHGVATPQRDQAEDEGAVMDSTERTEHDWSELREAVAKVLDLDPRDLQPKR